MEAVLIDTFTIPPEALEPFRARADEVQRFVKTLPGFVEGFSYQQVGGDSRFNVITVAVWANEAALHAAQQAVAGENGRRGLNPEEFRQRLGIVATRASYRRSSY